MVVEEKQMRIASLAVKGDDQMRTARRCALAVALCFDFASATAQQSPSAVDRYPAPSSGLDDGRPLHVARFDRTSDHALLAMERRAHELGIQGVAVVAYFDGDSVRSWVSKMIVVGSGIEDQPAQNQKVSNLLAIAYSKAAEMADTLKNSGSQVRPPLTGEFGWNGGAIARGKHGYLVAAFSGGKGDQDFSVSTAGIEEMKKGM
jgi:hypothetical protein